MMLAAWCQGDGSVAHASSTHTIRTQDDAAHVILFARGLVRGRRWARVRFAVAHTCLLVVAEALRDGVTRVDRERRDGLHGEGDFLHCRHDELYGTVSIGATCLLWVRMKEGREGWWVSPTVSQRP
ncbi:hypothetical protein EXIGLDRAFT_89486 [Exidia glandulosa HHB12029]|uniref:Uncharacterized protein n=1 Tax=Exidia glandulosa HHB12029 TaxID=1314781 RepID=A0A165NV67_EXIGL|nr:hypothetical protein EXIGLDRAFT_89486 [Exidia glandulosa HHB12029]